jgi:DNA mismatch repair protein MutS
MSTPSVPPRDSEQWKTPLYQQYWRLKDQAPAALLFFRLGDFYELFGEDAVQAAPLLEVQLTARDRKAENPIPMCGVPAHAWASYAEKLLSRGLKIALGEQLSDPSEAKNKIVDRGISRILTPGLPVDFRHLQSKKKHYLLTLSWSGSEAEALLLDFLERSLWSAKLESQEDLRLLLSRFDPAEILLSEKADPKQAFWSELEDDKRISTIDAQGSSRELLSRYLEFTQRWDADALARYLPSMAKSVELHASSASPYASISPEVLAQWNIFPDLFEALDASGSSLGSRRLREMLYEPLKDEKRLRRRYKLFASLEHYKSLLAETRKVQDMERLLGRFRVGVAHPKELLRFLASMRSICEVMESEAGRASWHDFFADEGLVSLAQSTKSLRGLVSKLERVLVEDQDVARIEGLKDLVREGFDADFDDLKKVFTKTQVWLENYEAELRSQTEIPSLKIRYNRVFGFYIEVTKTHLAKVPSTFERRQTMVNAERFTTSELLAKEKEVLSADSNIENEAARILREVVTEIQGMDSELKMALLQFSWIDAWCGLRRAVARLERFGPWSEPVIEGQAPFFELVDGRHPLVEMLQGSFVSNSLRLSQDEDRILLLTGPNMAGKSTLMRQCGLALYLAQVGLFVPATQLRFRPFDRFFSRMGATDRILEGESTFMVEMKEMSQMLREMTSESFLLIDEIGRGTSTEDGLAIAQALLEHLHAESRALMIFATHYHELSEVAAELPRCRNASMGIREWEGELVFLRSLEMKPASSSYGIHVAKMAGIPQVIVDRAQKLWGAEEGSTPAARPAKERVAPLETLPLFSQSVKARPRALEELAQMDLNELSPRAAWDYLKKLQIEDSN